MTSTLAHAPGTHRQVQRITPHGDARGLVQPTPLLEGKAGCKAGRGAQARGLSWEKHPLKLQLNCI